MPSVLEPTITETGCAREHMLFPFQTNVCKQDLLVFKVVFLNSTIIGVFKAEHSSYCTQLFLSFLHLSLILLLEGQQLLIPTSRLERFFFNIWDGLGPVCLARS